MPETVSCRVILPCSLVLTALQCTSVKGFLCQYSFFLSLVQRYEPITALQISCEKQTSIEREEKGRMSAFPADVSYNAAQGTEALLFFTVVGRENIKMQFLKVVQRHLMCNTGRKEQICGQIREEIRMDVEKKKKNKTDKWTSEIDNLFSLPSLQKNSGVYFQ